MTDARPIFERIASRYDAINRTLSLGTDVFWRRRAVAKLSRLASPRRILDVACGTADLSIALARRFPAAKLTGIDISEGMLEIGRRKVAAAGLEGRVSLSTGNAMALAFPDKSFDVVACSFGIRNFPDPAKGLAEFERVLAPGGRILVMEFFRPPRLLGALVNAWISLAGRLVAPAFGAEYRYFRASIDRMLTEREFAEAAGRLSLVSLAHLRDLPSSTTLVFGKGEIAGA